MEHIRLNFQRIPYVYVLSVSLAADGLVAWDGLWPYALASGDADERIVAYAETGQNAAPEELLPPGRQGFTDRYWRSFWAPFVNLRRFIERKSHLDSEEPPPCLER